MTGPALHKVIYKPDSQSTDEFILIVNLEEYRRWKEAGDTSIPLSQVVDSFDIFHSVQGNQGRLGKASKQQLENIFGTSRDDDVVHQMLEKGILQAGGEINPGSGVARYGARLDTRGSGPSLRGV